ncbi:MAG: hypothetical protein ACRDBH_02205, partial [Bosea sp. (in: a-proteobacteria)]
TTYGFGDRHSNQLSYSPVPPAIQTAARQRNYVFSAARPFLAVLAVKHPARRVQLRPVSGNLIAF